MNPERPIHIPPCDTALRMAWVPILLVIILIPFLWASETQGAFVSLPLAVAMNILTRTFVAVLIAILAGRSFLMSGRPELLLLGCGIGIWGVAGGISIILGCFRSSSGMTVASLGVLLSGLCHMIGVNLSTRSKTIRVPGLPLAVGYSVAFVAIGLVALAEVAGWTPVFFIEDTGGTAIRHVVLGSAVAMFVVTAIMLRAENRPSQSSFTQWYAYALLMIAVGQLGMMIESSRFSMLGWMCRVTQSVGGLYMLIAVLASVRETGTWGISLVEALRESEERFRLFMDNSPTIAWIKDANGRNIYVNQTFLNRFQVRREDIFGKTDDDLSQVENPKHYRDRDLETLEAGRPIEFMERFRNPDGTIGDWIVIKFPLCDSGGIPYVAGIGLDVTERKQAEEDLRRSEERMRMALLISHSFSFEWDPASDRVLRSESCRPVLGQEAISETGEHYIQRIHPEDRDQFTQFLKSLSPEKDRYQCQYRIKRVDGTFTVLEETARASFGADGGLKRVVGVATDITERKRAEEELKELNQALELRVNTRTRELKNTIRQLQVLAQKLTQAEEHERGRLAEVLHDDLQQVLVAAKLYLARVALFKHDDGKRIGLIEDTDHLLDEAILITRNLSHELSPPFFSQQDLIATLKWLCWQMKTKYDLAIRFSGDDEIEVDDTLKVFLFRAAREILFNIVKHAEVNEAELDIRQVGQELEMAISDHGKGFDISQFGPHPWIGTGFGLFSIQERAGLMGGNLLIDSAPGRGSMFKMKVPLNMLAGMENGDGAGIERPAKKPAERPAKTDA